jgi:histidinol-phosphate aminotransferase
VAQDIIYLDRNENNYGPAPACYEVLRTAGLEQMSWYSKDFARGVKSALSERLAKEYGVPESIVLLGYGGEDLLKQTVHCYLSKGDTIMIPTHSWWYYKAIAAEKGGFTVEYPMLPGPDAFVYDVDGLLRLARQHGPRVVLISSPNNPTGNSLDLIDLRRVLHELVGSIVVLDEAYWGFGGTRDNYVKDLINDFPNLIIIRTFSKYFAMAGLRIGYAFMGRGLTQLAQFSARYLGYNQLSEKLALAALDSTEYYAGISARMIEDKEMLYRTINGIPGFKAYRSNANFILADIPAAQKDALKADLTRRGLIIKFFKNEPFLDYCVRITIGTREQNQALAAALTAFAAEKGLR